MKVHCEGFKGLWEHCPDVGAPLADTSGGLFNTAILVIVAVLFLMLLTIAIATISD